MKVSNATSARATEALQDTGQSSGRQPPTLITADFALTGPSDLPDPRFNAYRKDLADVALAGRVIASHYAQPVARKTCEVTILRTGPSSESEPISQLGAEEQFLMLDDTLGWAWGYAGSEHLVGYLPSNALTERHER